VNNWQLQGELLGSMTTVKDWTNAMNTQGATSNPGTVQIHIDRALAKAKAEALAIDPIVATYDHKAPINEAVGCKACNFVAKLAPLYQFTVNGGWVAL